jgi:hypothetical protein
VIIKWVSESFVCKEPSVDTVENTEHRDYCNRNRKGDVRIKIVMWDHQEIAIIMTITERAILK